MASSLLLQIVWQEEMCPGFSEMAKTAWKKVTFPVIRVCVAYEKDGVRTTDMPFDTAGWQAVYEDLPGWQTDLTGLTSESQFPKAFSDYVAYLEHALRTPITIVSVGPDRDQTIIR